jgi:uncharacterized membrane protein YhhN
MLTAIIIIFIIILSLKIFFSIKNNLFLKYLLTPLTTLTIILLPLLHLYSNISPYSVLITLALILSLAGDIFNMIEDNSALYLPFGIIFFMLAHIVYIINFMKGYSFAYYQLIIIFIIFVTIFITSIIFKFNSAIHKIGIGIYTLLVSATMVIAIGNLGSTFTTRGILISIGAVLFCCLTLYSGYIYSNIKLKTIHYMSGLFMRRVSY